MSPGIIKGYFITRNSQKSDVAFKDHLVLADGLKGCAWNDGNYFFCVFLTCSCHIFLTMEDVYEGFKVKMHF